MNYSDGADLTISSHLCLQKKNSSVNEDASPLHIFVFIVSCALWLNSLGSFRFLGCGGTNFRYVLPLLNLLLINFVTILNSGYSLCESRHGSPLYFSQMLIFLCNEIWTMT